MSTSWHTLPTEMQLQVVGNLDVADARTFSAVDQRTYAACVPVLFRVSFSVRQCLSIRTLEFFRQDVKLNTQADLERFLENVPRAYCRHIEMLDVGTEGQARVHADALISLLLASPRLAQLVLRLNGSLDSSVVSSFGFLANLRHLSIRNCAEEVILPL